MISYPINAGDTVSRLKVLMIVPVAYWAWAVVKCQCGKIKLVQIAHLLQGRVKSCGCLRKEYYGRGKHKPVRQVSRVRRAGKS